MAKSNRKPVESPVPQTDSTPTAPLAAIVSATQASAFIYVNSTAPEIMDLISKGLIETNPAMVNERGEVAARATAIGLSAQVAAPSPAPFVPASPAPAPAPIGAPPASKYQRVTFDEIPATKRKGFAGREPEFPFDDLIAPSANNGKFDGFFVPVSEKRPEPWRSLASTVTSANSRYAVATGERETVMISVYQTDASGKRVKVNGHFVKIGEQTVTQDVTQQTREFVLRAAPDNSGAHVLRVL